MPLQRCEKNGWRWGKEGSCYHGKDAKKKALKQGYAINPEEFKKEVGEMKELELMDQIEILLGENND